jgi:hypothetical protein
MPNSIELAKHYARVFDEVYEAASLTGDLTIPPAFFTEGVNAGEVKIAKEVLVGLGKYSKTSGYPAGDATLTWETHSYSYDRGRKFSIDKADNMESALMAMSGLASRFISKYVVPEVDAVRFSILGTGAGHDAYGILDSSAETVAAVDTAVAALGDDGVPLEDLIMYLTFTQYNLLKRSDEAGRFTLPGQDPDARFGRWDGIKVIPVPSNRFYGEVSLNDGSSSSAGGYTNAGGAINFIIMDKGAAFAHAKLDEIRLWSPNGENGLPVNPDANAWRMDYRLYHDLFIPDNAADGIYVHGNTDIVS